MKLLSTVLGLAFFFTGCTTFNKSQPAAPVEVGLSSNLQADIDVDMSKQIKGSVHHTRLFGFIPIKNSDRFADGVGYGVNGGGGLLSFLGPGMVDEAKAAAAYKAVVPNKADVIVAPQYLVKVKNYLGIWKEVTVNVTGYAGKIRDIKSIPVKK